MGDNHLNVGNGKRDTVPIQSSLAGVTQPITYTWEDIEVETQEVQGFFCRKNRTTTRKRILEHVTGAVKPGEFLTIMGANGAGKTTFLNCLTFRNSGTLKISGKRLLNGKAVDTDTLARISGYVQQDDLFIGTLNVDEVLRFQALLRMDKHYTYKERMARVEDVIFEFGLTKCRHTLIGNLEKGIKGISGGEKKRLALACELLTNPSLMFCDEPTSGLDSFMAQNIVQTLKNLASQGKTVICIIHQPSSEIFAMFDRILLMAEGRTAFLGPVNEALPFFASQGMPCPPNYNPADFYIFTLAIVPGQKVESKNRIKAICDAYDASDARRCVEEVVRDQHKDQSNGNEFTQNRNRSSYKVGWFSQFRAVLWRSFLSVLRDPQIFMLKGATTVFIALLIALVYQSQNLNPENVQNFQGVLFLFVTTATFESILPAINTFSFEVPIFLREHFNGMYRTDVYFLSKTIAEICVYITFPMITFIIPYYVIGLNPLVERLFIGAGILVLVSNVATSFGYFVSCLASTYQVALGILSPLIVPMLLFGGFLFKIGSVPFYLDWIHYISWFMYGYEALSINQWKDVKFNNTNCQYLAYNLTEILPDLNNAQVSPEVGKLITITSDVFGAFQQTIVCRGEDMLNQLALNADSLLRDILCLCTLVVGFRILAFFALLNKTYRK